MKKTLSFIFAVIMIVSTVSAISQISALSVGDVISFGSYPQAQVTESALIKSLNKLNLSWDSYDYYSGNDDSSNGKMKSGSFMKYADVTYKGDKYRAVKFSKYRPCYSFSSCSKGNSYQDEYGYTTDKVYWFKYQPLKWKVLDTKSGMLVSEKVIDSQCYQNMTYQNSNGYWYTSSSCKKYANNYSVSSIKTWLNSDFYKTAFSSVQQTMLLSKSYAYNAVNTKYSSGSGTDKVTLLSSSDVSNKNYKLNTSSLRKATTTSYAKSQGIYVGKDSKVLWMLRTAGQSSEGQAIIDQNGNLEKDYYVNATFVGIRPVIYVSSISCASKNHKIEKKLAKKATPDEDGYYQYTCTSDGKTFGKILIKKVSKITISKTSFAYNGRIQKPTVTVKNSDGETLNSKYYTIKYSDQYSIGAGKYTVTITLKGNYSGTKILSYKITD